MLQLVSGCALIIFAAAMVVIGIIASKKTRTIDGFLLGGRKMGAWMSAFAYGTTYFSAVLFIGFAGKFGWDIGFPSMWIGIGNAVFGCLAAWFVLARRTRSMTHTLSVRTMPEFFGARYLSTGMKLFAAVIVFVFLLPYAASVYKGLGSLFGVIFPNVSELLFGLEPDVACMAIVALLTAVYLVMGGFVATALNDFIQGIIMIVGVIVLAAAIFLSPQVGGISGITLKLGEFDISQIFGGSSWNFLMINILLTSFGTWALPQMINKFYAIRDEAAIKKATVVSTVFALIIGSGAYFVGTFGKFFVATGPDGTPVGGYDMVVPNMLNFAFGGSLAGSILLSVILLLVLSASMSTLSAIVLTSASAITVDFAGSLKRAVSKASQMRWTRLLCFVFVILSFVFATFKFSFIFSIMAYSWGIVSGCFIGPYIWGLYSKKTTRAGAWAGMTGGLATVVLFAAFYTATSPKLTEGVYAAFQDASSSSPVFGVTAMAVSFVLVPIVSRFTRKLSAEHVSMVFSKTGKKAESEV